MDPQDKRFESKVLDVIGWDAVGCSRSQALKRSHMLYAHFTKALDALIESGQVISITRPKTDTEPPTVIVWLTIA